MRRSKKRLNELLLDYGLIKEKDVLKALDIQRQTGNQLATILIEEGYVKEEDILTCFCRYLSVPPISLKKFKAKDATIKIIPEHVASQVRRDHTMWPRNPEELPFLLDQPILLPHPPGPSM